MVYLREVMIEVDTDGALLEVKLGIFKGNEKDLPKDKAYWLAQEGITSVKYFRLGEEYKS